MEVATMSHQVFISFSSKDIRIAEKIYDRLERNNIPCWISSKNIPPGADYQVCIVDAISQAKIVVLVFSRNANDSNEVAKELALASKKILIPTRIEDVPAQGAFQYQLSNRQFVNLFDDFDNQLDTLADRIKIAISQDAAVASPLKPKIENRTTIGFKSAVAAGIVVLSATAVLVFTLPQPTVLTSTQPVTTPPIAVTSPSEAAQTTEAPKLPTEQPTDTQVKPPAARTTAVLPSLRPIPTQVPNAVPVRPAVTPSALQTVPPTANPTNTGRCNAIVARSALGEPLTPEDRQELLTSCR